MKKKIEPTFHKASEEDWMSNEITLAIMGVIFICAMAVLTYVFLEAAN